MLNNNKLFLCSLVACLVSGCELSEPMNVGPECPGIQLNAVIHLESDTCVQRDTCKEEDQDAVARGYCPLNFTCTYDKSGQPSCMHACETGKVRCNAECIDPQISMTNCGASLNGACSDTRESNENFMGHNCNALSTENKMICIDGKCQADNCDSGQHLAQNEDGTMYCKPDSKAACGSEDNVCEEYQICRAGKCTKECGNLNDVICGDQCIDPQSSPDYCGADDKCEKYVKCTEEQVCTNGTCRILDCLSKTEMRCTIDGVEQCVDITSDLHRCGGCDIDCDARRPAYSIVDSCSEGRCTFKCQENYTNCATPENPVCANLNNSYEHCGSCGNSCTGNQACRGGDCVDSQCEPNICFQQEQCKPKNDPTACGVSCTNCAYTYKAETATCDDEGQCHVVKCEKGYHLTATQTCEANTNKDCGSQSIANAENCTQWTNVSAAECSDTGECVVKSCNASSHLYNNTCEANSDANCGDHDAACTVANGTSKCVGASCVTQSCKTGYYKDGEACKAEDVQNCGQKGYACADHVSNWGDGTCQSGKCVVTSCKNGSHLYEGACEPNSATHCLEHGKSCAGTITYAQTYGCDDSLGCIVTACTTGYHPSSIKRDCVADSNYTCGNALTNCTTYPDKDRESYKCESGKCVFQGCKSKYYLITNLKDSSKKTCVPACNSMSQTSIQSYISGYECGRGYHSTKCSNGPCTSPMSDDDFFENMHNFCCAL